MATELNSGFVANADSYRTRQTRVPPSRPQPAAIERTTAPTSTPVRTDTSATGPVASYAATLSTSTTTAYVSTINRDPSRLYADNMYARQTLSTMTESELADMVANVNAQLIMRNLRLSYTVHEPTNRIAMTVYDRDTHEVVREIPPECQLDRLALILEMKGIFMNERG